MGWRGLAESRQPIDLRPGEEPSDGLEPSTPSLPCDFGGNRWQPVAKRFGLLRRFRGFKRSNRLRPIAPSFFHNLSILSATARSAVCRTDDVGSRKLAIAFAVDPSLTAKGSSSDALSGRVRPAEGVAATDRDDEPLRVRGAVRTLPHGGSSPPGPISRRR